MAENGFREWCILELMGHRRLAGEVSEAEIGGSKFLRIDVPGKDGVGGEPRATQFYSPAAVYCMTPTTEAIARAFAAAHQPEPVTRWDLPSLPERAPVEDRHEFAPDADDMQSDNPDDELEDLDEESAENAHGA